MSELFLLFFKLGCIGFGGPQAHVAMMESECVRQRRWLTAERFAQGLALCNLLPGPASTQLAIWIGYERRRWLGAIGAGLLFILPAFVLVTTLAGLYVRYGELPQVRGLLIGFKPAVVAVILTTCDRLWKPLAKRPLSAWFLFGALILTLMFPAWIALILIAAGAIGILAGDRPAPAASVHIWPLFLYFFKSGALIFGGGLVLVPLLRGDLVTAHGWLTGRQFMDAVAVGQLTPGPVVITSAFIGYLLGGVAGAAAAAAGMFLPSFLMILAAAPFLDRITEKPWVKAAMAGLMPAVVGSILAATLSLAAGCVVRSVDLDVLQLVLLAAGLIATVRFKANAGLVVTVSGVVGLLTAH